MELFPKTEVLVKPQCLYFEWILTGFSCVFHGFQRLPTKKVPKLPAKVNKPPVDPEERTGRSRIECDKEKYKKRGYIERVFWKLKENLRLTVRYEKSDMNFLGFIMAAFVKILIC
jgi:hypothetical protein